MVRRLPRVPILLALLLLIAALAFPLPYVIVEPGDPQNVLGKVEKGSKNRLIEITGVKTFSTTGKLNLTSIYVTSPESKIFGIDVLGAWFDGERSVQPREVFFPKGVSSKEVDQQNSLDMLHSQEHAKVSALNFLGYKIPEKMIISSITKESPNSKILANGDVITKLNGVRVTSATAFKKLLSEVILLDLVFSIDSIITAVGMVQQLWIMYAAVIVAVVIMLIASKPISSFIQKHPSFKILALCFLLMIGVSLIAEGLHFAIPKGYIYFSMAFAFLVDLIQMKRLKMK